MSLSLVKLNLLLPQNLVKAQGWFITGRVSMYLVKVPLLSSLVLGPLSIKGCANIGKGFLENPRLRFPHGDGLLPLRELLVTPRFSKRIEFYNVIY
jgi:hypothetical protein